MYHDFANWQKHTCIHKHTQALTGIRKCDWNSLSATSIWRPARSISSEKHLLKYKVDVQVFVLLAIGTVRYDSTWVITKHDAVIEFPRTVSTDTYSTYRKLFQFKCYRISCTSGNQKVLIPWGRYLLERSTWTGYLLSTVLTRARYLLTHSTHSSTVLIRARYLLEHAVLTRARPGQGWYGIYQLTFNLTFILVFTWLLKS